MDCRLESVGTPELPVHTSVRTLLDISWHIASFAIDEQGMLTSGHLNEEENTVFFEREIQYSVVVFPCLFSWLRD